MIEYPSTTPYTLQELVYSEDRCYAFLQDLYGAAGRPFFYSYGGGDVRRQTPVDVLSNSMWELVLPYAIVHALVSRSAACEYKPGRRTRKAPQYALDAFVYNHWHREWDTLRYLEGAPWKRQRQEGTRGCIVTFTPYNSTRRARLSRESGSGSELSDYFLSLAELWGTAYGKQQWWYVEFYT